MPAGVVSASHSSSHERPGAERGGYQWHSEASFLRGQSSSRKEVQEPNRSEGEFSQQGKSEDNDVDPAKKLNKMLSNVADSMFTPIPEQDPFTFEKFHRGIPCVYKLVQQPIFKLLVNLTIVINVLQMGFAADYKTGDWREVWFICENVFVTVFALEMALKILGLGKDYFFDGWNVMDFVVAWISIVDCWFIGESEDDEGNGLGVVRVIRLLRLLRIIKVLRVAPELVVVIEGIVTSMKSMFWVMTLLTIIVYAFGIVCVDVIGSSSDYTGSTSDKEVIQTALVDNFNSWAYFGSLPRSMISLFSMILLAEWATIVRPIWEVQMPMIAIFVFMIIITTFGVLNVIIGIIVDRTTAAMNAMRETEYRALKQAQMRTVEDLVDLMYKLDADSDDKITLEEFEAARQNPSLNSILHQISFPSGFSLEELHRMLDMDGSGGVSKNEFINGMMRLIYCNQFQRECLSMSSLGQIKSMIAIEAKDRRVFEGRVLEELRALKADVNGSSVTSSWQYEKPKNDQSETIMDIEADIEDLPNEPGASDCYSEKMAATMRKYFDTQPDTGKETGPVNVNLEDRHMDAWEKRFKDEPAHLSPPPDDTLNTAASGTSELVGQNRASAGNVTSSDAKVWEPVETQFWIRADQAEMAPKAAASTCTVPDRIHELVSASCPACNELPFERGVARRQVAGTEHLALRVGR